MFGLFGISLAVLGFGKMTKQEINRSFETIDSRNEAKRKGNKTYVDGYGSSRLTENTHLVIWSKDKDGVSCMIDLDDHGKVVVDDDYLRRKEEHKKAEEHKRKTWENFGMSDEERKKQIVESEKKYQEIMKIIELYSNNKY